MQADTAPETRPRRATTASTLSHAICDADHRLSISYFGPRHFCSTHDAHRISCCANRSSPRRFRWAHARQPRATSALLVARSAGVTPGTSRVARRAAGRLGDGGVTYYSVDLGRVQHGGRDNDADRDATVIPVIPERRPHQGAISWRAVTTAPGRLGTGGGPVPARGRRRPRVPAWLGHQFQLRMALSFPLSGRCRRAGSPVPVAHCRSSRSQGFLEVSVVTSSSCASAVPSGSEGHFGRGRSHGFPLCGRAPPRARFARRVTRSSCASRTSFREPPGGRSGWAGRAYVPLRRCG